MIGHKRFSLHPALSEHRVPLRSQETTLPGRPVFLWESPKAEAVMEVLFLEQKILLIKHPTHLCTKTQTSGSGLNVRRRLREGQCPNQTSFNLFQFFSSLLLIPTGPIILHFLWVKLKLFQKLFHFPLIYFLDQFARNPSTSPGPFLFRLLLL